MTSAKTIWKFPVEFIEETQEITLPGPGKPVLFAEQTGGLFVWWEVRPGHPEQVRRVQVVGTGDVILGDCWEHVGSLQKRASVWHLYADIVISK